MGCGGPGSSSGTQGLQLGGELRVWPEWKGGQCYQWVGRASQGWEVSEQADSSRMGKALWRS